MEPSVAAKLYAQQSAPSQALTDQAYGDQMSSSDEFLMQFGLRIAQLVAPTAHVQAVQQAVRQTILEANALANGPHSISSQPSTQQRQLELVYVHDCRNHGCNRAQCVLCKHNPNKRCTGNFAHKYWVGDKLLAKCDGEIQIELVDGLTGEQVTDDLMHIRLELCILDGNKFSSRCREVGEQRMEILDECEVLKNQKGEPLMVAGGITNTTETPQVALKFRQGETFVSLKEVKVTESSESVLAGTKRPPFRMVVRATDANGARMTIRPAVSEEFVVVTKRTKNLKKQEIPSLDDPISKLNHIGKETVKKLNELKASADEMNLDLKLPRELCRITKVREFQRVAKLCEADGHMQQKLKQLLKLSKEKWDAACEHAKTAVQVDNRMRAWYMKNMSVGLLYNCSLGDLRPDAPVALLQNRRHEGVDFMEVVPMEHQLPAQRDQVQASCEQAMRLWWDDFHPGWMIFTLGNRHFETLTQIIQYSQSTMLKGSLLPGDPSNLQDNGFSSSDAHGYAKDTTGIASDLQAFGHPKGMEVRPRGEHLSYGGHPPWPGGGGAGGADHHMSAQQESAALLKELYAQQLASSQAAEGRASTAQSSGLGQFGAGRGGYKGEGPLSRPTGPNPFEGYTGTTFPSSIDTGRREASDAGMPQQSSSWMHQIGGLGSVNSETAHNPNVNMSLSSLSNFMKHNSGNHSIVDLASVSGPGCDYAQHAVSHTDDGRGLGPQPQSPSRGNKQQDGPGRGSHDDGWFLRQLQQQRQQLQHEQDQEKQERLESKPASSSEEHATELRAATKRPREPSSSEDNCESPRANASDNLDEGTQPRHGSDERDRKQKKIREDKAVDDVDSLRHKQASTRKAAPSDSAGGKAQQAKRTQRERKPKSPAQSADNSPRDKRKRSGEIHEAALRNVKDQGLANSFAKKSGSQGRKSSPRDASQAGDANIQRHDHNIAPVMHNSSDGETSDASTKDLESDNEGRASHVDIVGNR